MLKMLMVLLKVRRRKKQHENWFLYYYISFKIAFIEKNAYSSIEDGINEQGKLN